jgi:hypothetical protein
MAWPTQITAQARPDPTYGQIEEAKPFFEPEPAFTGTVRGVDSANGTSRPAGTTICGRLTGGDMRLPDDNGLHPDGAADAPGVVRSSDSMTRISTSICTPLTLPRYFQYVA